MKLNLIVGSSSFARFAHSRGKQVSRESKCPVEIFVWEPHQNNHFSVKHTIKNKNSSTNLTIYGLIIIKMKEYI
jgi:hypothetical protein